MLEIDPALMYPCYCIKRKLCVVGQSTAACSGCSILGSAAHRSKGRHESLNVLITRTTRFTLALIALAEVDPDSVLDHDAWLAALAEAEAAAEEGAEPAEELATPNPLHVAIFGVQRGEGAAQFARSGHELM